MPVYQYACTECGEQLEVRQSFTDDALTVCPVCEGRLRKVLSAVGVVFKGSGFYRTDSREAAKSSNGSSGAADTASSTTSGSGSDSTTSSSSSSSGSDSGSSSGSGSGSGSTSTSSTGTPAKAS